jgi:Polysaccharide pyruvyl transferase
MRALVAGWFSFEQMGATAGDLIAAGIAGEWLHDAGYEEIVVARAAPFADVVDWKSLDPADLDLVVFVCGPFGNGPPVTEFLRHFAGCRLVGLDLSMLQPVSEWDPFDLLIERDSERVGRPDITFAGSSPTVPVIGVIKVHPQEEYGSRARHHEADRLIDELLGDTEAARIEIDTRLDLNVTGLRTPGEVEALVARCDATVTTRLHGTVMSLKNGVPSLVIDPIAGGGKVIRQARTLGWPYAFTIDELGGVDLARLLSELLTPAARASAAQVGATARRAVEEITRQFVQAAAGPAARSPGAR